MRTLTTLLLLLVACSSPTSEPVVPTTMADTTSTPPVETTTTTAAATTTTPETTTTTDASPTPESFVQWTRENAHRSHDPDAGTGDDASIIAEAQQFCVDMAANDWTVDQLLVLFVGFTDPTPTSDQVLFMREGLELMVEVFCPELADTNR